MAQHRSTRTAGSTAPGWWTGLPTLPAGQIAWRTIGVALGLTRAPAAARHRRVVSG